MISANDIPVEVVTIPLMITLFVFVVAILLFIFIRYVFVIFGVLLCIHLFSMQFL